MPRKYIKFTGKYADLKPMGFTFQKLYAENFMQWERGDVSVWKRDGGYVRLDMFINNEVSLLVALINARATGAEQCGNEMHIESNKIRCIFNNVDDTADFSHEAYDEYSNKRYEWWNHIEEFGKLFPKSDDFNELNAAAKQQWLDEAHDKYNASVGYDIRKFNHIYQCEYVPVKLADQLMDMYDAGQIEVAER